jgi:hypothetical protein
VLDHVFTLLFRWMPGIFSGIAFTSFMHAGEMNFVQCCAAIVHLPVFRVVFGVVHDRFIPAACRAVVVASAGAYAIR